MASFGRYGSHSYAPSAPSLPEDQNNNTIKIPPFLPPPPSQHQQQSRPSSHGFAYSSYSSGGSFPPETHPDVIRSFQMVDRDGSGSIDENELQRALSSSGFQMLSLRTIRLLIFLFANPSPSPSPSRPLTLTIGGFFFLFFFFLSSFLLYFLCTSKFSLFVGFPNCRLF